MGYLAASACHRIYCLGFGSLGFLGGVDDNESPTLGGYMILKESIVGCLFQILKKIRGALQTWHRLYLHGWLWMDLGDLDRGVVAFWGTPPGTHTKLWVWGCGLS